MNSMFIFTFVVFGISAFVLQAKRDSRMLQIFNILLFIAVAQLLISDFDRRASTMIYMLTALLAFNFLLSRLAVFQRKFLRFLVPLISLSLYLFIYRHEIISYHGEEFMAINKFLVLGLIMAVIGYEIAEVKYSVLEKHLGGMKKDDFINSLLLFFTATAIYLGMFQSMTFGLMLVASGYLSASFFRRDTSHKVFVSILILSVLPYLLNLLEESNEQLLNGDTLGGLFLGAFSMFFIQKLWSASKPKTGMIILGYSLVLSLAFMLLFAGSIYVHMGGMDAFVGVLIGVALMNVVHGSGYVLFSLFPLLLAGALFLPRYMVNEEQYKFQQEMLLIEKNESDRRVEEELVLLSLSEITGSYNFIPKESKVSFELGKEGETKGAITDVVGSVVLDNQIEGSKLKVVMKVANLTTFIKSRDRAIMGEDYLNESQFPEMKFISKSYDKISEEEYLIKGDFSLLGFSKEVEVNCRATLVNEVLFLIGNGELDRTDFGMAPAPSEGNSIEFNYQVALEK